MIIFSTSSNKLKLHNAYSMWYFINSKRVWFHAINVCHFNLYLEYVKQSYSLPRTCSELHVVRRYWRRKFAVCAWEPFFLTYEDLHSEFHIFLEANGDASKHLKKGNPNPWQQRMVFSIFFHVFLTSKWC